MIQSGLNTSSIFIFKAWFAQRQETFTLSGEPNQAFIGFSDFVYQLLYEIAPSRVVFAFDESPRQSERNTIYADYKANRSPTPEDLKKQFSWCRQWVENLGISAVSSNSWEADDLVGQSQQMGDRRVVRIEPGLHQWLVVQAAPATDHLREPVE